MSSNGDRDQGQGPALTGERRTGVSFQFTILTLFLLIVVPWSVAITIANYTLNRGAALDAAQVLLEQVDRTVAGEIARLFEPVITFAGMVAEFPGVTQSPDEDGHPALPMLLSSVEKNRAVASEYIGFDNGDMVLVIDLGEGYEDTRAGYDVPGTSRFVVQSYFTRADGVRVSTVTFLDADRQVTMSGLERDPTYDPRLRPWYLAAPNPPARSRPSLMFRPARSVSGSPSPGAWTVPRPPSSVRTSRSQALQPFSTRSARAWAFLF